MTSWRRDLAYVHDKTAFVYTLLSCRPQRREAASLTDLPHSMPRPMALCCEGWRELARYLVVRWWIKQSTACSPQGIRLNISEESGLGTPQVLDL